MKRTALTIFLGLVGLMGGNSLAPAQAVYPEKSLQLICPFPPGGASDVVARIIGSELETRLGKPVINHEPSRGRHHHRGQGSRALGA